MDDDWLHAQPEWQFFAEALAWHSRGHALTGAQTFGVIEALRDALRSGRVSPGDLGMVPTADGCWKLGLDDDALRVPGEVPFCAGRQAVAHPPVPMSDDGEEGWECPVCGEVDDAVTPPVDTGVREEVGPTETQDRTQTLS